MGVRPAQECYEARVSERDDKPNVQWLEIDAEHAGQRLDNFLLARLKGAPKSLVYRILRKGEVRVNKGRAKPEQRLQAGDVVRIPPVRLGEKAPPRAGEELKHTLEQAVLHEDAHLLVLNKPHGLPVHAGSGVHVGVIEALRDLRPDLPGLELAHRLDRDTSGVLVLVKDRPTLLRVHALLREETAHKTYHALVHGHLPERLTEVRAPLEKNALRGGERLVEVRPDGKPSLTRFRILERFAEATLVEASPITGRTHQIRVHAAHAGHPIALDDKYGDARRDAVLKTIGLKRLFLHAARIELSFGDKTLCVRAPLPDALSSVLEALRAQRSA
jgi:23S rRNA pseudouridine955/2504/2580 synthase